MTFDEAFDQIISPSFEGGYSSHSLDPGGETKFGISKRSYPHLDIKSLTREQVKPIYKVDFWGRAGCDAVPDVLKYPLFDFAVNSGPATAAKTLQRRIGVVDDGMIGPITLMEIRLWPEKDLALALCLDRLKLLSGLPQWPAFGRGWTNRVRRVMAQILEIPE